MELKKELLPDEIRKRQKTLFCESSKEIIDAIEKEILKCNFPIRFTNSFMEVNHKLKLDGDFFIEFLEQFVKKYNNHKASEYAYVIIDKTVLAVSNEQLWGVSLDLRKKIND